MKTLFLTCGEPCQIALAAAVAQRSDLQAIVVAANRTRRAPSALTTWRRRIEARAAGLPLTTAWIAMQKHYERSARWPSVPLERVSNINDASTFALIERHAPAFVMVSGTSLLSRALIEHAALHGCEIVNLHTGISPYIKGGPNCTHWCLAENAFHLIGSTVMWIDAGVDTGDLICTERAPLDGTESLEALHVAVMRHAHDLYVRVLDARARGERLPRVPQRGLGKGRTFRNADWTAAPMLRAYANYRLRYSPSYFASARHRDAVQATPLVSLVAARP